jgi:hypothetical protein
MQAAEHPSHKRTAPSPEPEATPAPKKAARGLRRNNGLPSATVPSAEKPTTPADAHISSTETEVDYTIGPSSSPRDLLYPAVNDGSNQTVDVELVAAETETTQATEESVVRDDVSEVKIEISELPIVYGGGFPFPIKEESVRRIQTLYAESFKVLGGEFKEEMDALKNRLYVAEDARFKAENEL